MPKSGPSDDLKKLRAERDKALLRAFKSFERGGHESNPRALFALAYVQAAYTVATSQSEKAKSEAMARMFDLQGLDVKKTQSKRQHGKVSGEVQADEEKMLESIKAQMGMGGG